ncbi:hypothetical protein CR970_02490 [Candidatus Saccharibacteria bacterium]|nr:MAG: hypothetical protein CR970_02490 [Candidatus Saccharibacteria bacterium]
MTSLLDAVRQYIRRHLKTVARLLNRLSGGRVTPNQVTWIGLLMHIPIALLIAKGYFVGAAGLLVVFGLFDVLDGELARLQKRASSAGMVLDATTDRLKEVLLYTGVAYSISTSDDSAMAFWAVLACGISLSVSYVKAKGETAVAKTSLNVQQINRLFQDGLLRFEIRMLLLVIGLLADKLLLAVVVIAIASLGTVLERLIRITKTLQAEEVK